MEDDDDDYGSDEFDSLPPGTLYELEQNAFQATQASASQYHSKPLSSNPLLRTQAVPLNNNAGSLRPPPRLHTGLTNDYNTLEVGELEAEVYDNVDKPHAIPHGQHVLATNPRFAVNEQLGDAMDVDEYYGQGNAAAELNARLVQMEQERERMLQELAEARMQVETKAGEISIIRRKQATMTQDYDLQIASLRKSMADEMAKHKQEVEAAMSEGKILATENVFLQQDLVDEAYQLRNYKSKHREVEAPVTPRKSRVLPFRDGFDDDEIAMISPSKSAARSKRATPTVPGKRKRQSSQDAPAPLQLNPAGVELIMADATDAPAEVDVAKRKSAEAGRNQRLMMRLLSHRTHPNQETDFEAMAKLAFPSEPHRPMSSIIMEVMARADPSSYVLEYTQTIASLWQRAISEKFYEPIPRFEAITRYSLMSDDVPLSELITPLVGVLQDTVEVNAVPRFKYAPASRDKRITRQTPQSDLQPLVDSTGAMRLLYQIACGVLHIKSAMETFWQNIRISFILVMLHPSHPLGDIVLLMNLLSTSIRADSFGPIRTSDQDQLDVQKWIVDRLTHMLSEPAIPDEGIEPYTAYDICAMRLEVLLLLESLTFNPMAPSQKHASMILALHPNALARLFRSMHDELDALYSSPPESDLRVALVNGLMRLIFGVMRQHGTLINMQEKLACVPGSKQKHLVVLTRLAFCDGTVLEAGIDDETVDMAHELLEEWTNPQEAESLAEAFPSSRRD
ncbi:hypothetical protein E8E15_001092 [Penicillium rubens]|uniref:Pc22g11680 protein n=2 Tax=Penicillium chrysogenum species complex TaxID=254878 RepID=B6HQM3_PENRW|nr:uncharacterized protein N7525_005162 [Penicillium rubens]KZN91340.1 hypothetical protein EN45_014720 [Penicillium chrysogenum]CAP98456.1 Pc22g11680 [Penicillium rubens Wisconsin 54-1255]KAF3012443.1 hypothetical protein E8E15_001092 [Penicillium rubens]KAJ5044144.1 hypothetical protein NUH16_000942 [Penicillium rubens]KAJ5839974.1 hypothetical protein N7525_005162 [Penicillium rubens]